MSFLIFVGAECLGFVLIKYSSWIVDNAGIRFDFFENFLGGGGTKQFVKILGLLLMFFGIWYLFR